MPCANNRRLALSSGGRGLLDADRFAFARAAAFPVGPESQVSGPAEFREHDDRDNHNAHECGEQKDSHNIAAPNGTPSCDEHVNETHRYPSTRWDNAQRLTRRRPGVVVTPRPADAPYVSASPGRVNAG